MQKSHYLRRVWDTSQVRWLALGFLVAINSIPTSTGIGLALTKSALVVTWWTPELRMVFDDTLDDLQRKFPWMSNWLRMMYDDL